jgi:2-dehydropantoate 2-reductase
MLDAPNGSILYNFAITRTMRLLLAEISLVIRSLPELRGLPNIQDRFSPERLETLIVSIADKTGKNISSMLADVRAGRKTEVRYINGYIVRRGEEMGMQCVCNYMMMQLVEGKVNMIQRENLDQVPVTEPDLNANNS